MMRWMSETPIRYICMHNTSSQGSANLRVTKMSAAFPPPLAELTIGRLVASKSTLVDVPASTTVEQSLRRGLTSRTSRTSLSHSLSHSRAEPQAQSHKSHKSHRSLTQSLTQSRSPRVFLSLPLGFPTRSVSTISTQPPQELRHPLPPCIYREGEDAEALEEAVLRLWKQIGWGNQGGVTRKLWVSETV